MPGILSEGSAGVFDSTCQHTEKPNFRTEVPRIARDFEKRFGTSAKQEIVEDLLVLQH